MFVSKLLSNLLSGTTTTPASPSEPDFVDVAALLHSPELNGPAKRSRPSNTTPQSITGQVRSFCAAVNPGAEPEYLPVQPTEWARPCYCHDDVLRLVHEQGGRIVFGWAIWLAPNLYIEAEHHAVHESAEGKLRDISPRPDGEERILFLRDEAEAFDFKTRVARPNKRRALDRHPVVLEFLACAEDFDGQRQRLFAGAGIEWSHGEQLAFLRRMAAAQQSFHAYARKKRR